MIQDRADAQQALKELAQLRSNKRDIENQEKLLQEELLEFYGPRKSLSVVDHAARTRTVGTKVVSERVTIDEEKLKKKLGARKYNKYTKRVLDKDKLYAAVQVEDVDPTEIAECSSVKESKYIRINHSKITHEEEMEEVED